MKLTVAIPSYNQGHLIGDTLRSALFQNTDFRFEVLVVDDKSTDNTNDVVALFPKVRFLQNKKNIGYTGNMNRCIKEAKGKYIVFLCSDDMFANRNVLQDIADIMDLCPNVSVIDRGYFQYMDGIPGAVVGVREKDVLISSVNPSGMAIRKSAATQLSDKIYVEFPTMVKEMLKTSTYKRLGYDTVAVRIHKHNQACSSVYYKGSLVQNWYELLGKSRLLWDFKGVYVCLKNRAGLKTLLSEIKTNLRLEPRILLSPLFWFFSALTILTPRWLLIRLSDLYRNCIGRLTNKVVRRQGGSVILNIGCGKGQRADSINIDVTAYPGVDKVVDLAKYPWGFKDGIVDGIYASHVIEHLPDQEKFIKECYRILKIGGFLKLNVPHSSSPSGIGCMGHYRTYSYNTFNQYLCVPFYMFKKPLFKTVEQKLLWWYEAGDCYGNVSKPIWLIISIVNPIINFFIRLSPLICENFWWAYVGGVKEVVWKGVKI